MEEERPRQRTSIHSLSDIYSTRWESFVVTGTKYANEGVIDRVCGYGLDQPDLTLKKMNLIPMIVSLLVSIGKITESAIYLLKAAHALNVLVKFLLRMWSAQNAVREPFLTMA